MFKTFPQFSKLTLADREEYEKLVKEYPPIADISFISMLTWWDEIGSADVAYLNENLLLSYWIPGDDDRSGLSLVGTNMIDESLCLIFDHLKNKKEPTRLVHVPEFVLDYIRYPELFTFMPERESDEYIVPVTRLSEMNDIPPFRQARITKFISGREEKLKVKELDLDIVSNQELLIAAIHRWSKKGINAAGSVVQKVVIENIYRAEVLSMKNICLFTDGELQAFCLYHQPHDHRYAIIDHVRINYDIPRLFECMTIIFASWFDRRGFEYVNLNADLDLARLRNVKLTLRPINFFRKYTIKPARA